MKKRRTEIKKIENREERKVTFTKRRDGLFSKAKKLSSGLFDHNVDIAAVAFSPGGKPFDFGKTSLVFDRYISSGHDHNNHYYSPEIKSQLDVDVSKLSTLTELQRYSCDLERLKANVIKCLDAKQQQQHMVVGSNGNIGSTTNASVINIDDSGPANQQDSVIINIDDSGTANHREWSSTSMIAEDDNNGSLNFGFEMDENLDLWVTYEELEEMAELLTDDTDSCAQGGSRGNTHNFPNFNLTGDSNGYEPDGFSADEFINELLSTV